MSTFGGACGRGSRESSKWHKKRQGESPASFFPVRENPFLFFYISFLSGEGAIRRIYLCCVYVTIQWRAQKGKRKFPRPW